MKTPTVDRNTTFTRQNGPKKNGSRSDDKFCNVISSSKTGTVSVGIKPLPLEFEFQGDKLTQRMRTRNVAWYDRDGYCVEIILVRTAPACVLKGQRYPAREAYPGPSQFGNLGWCFSHPDRAKREEGAESKYRQLVERARQRASENNGIENPALSPRHPTLAPSWRIGGVH